MNTQNTFRRISLTASLAILVTAAMVGCGSPVSSPDADDMSPMMKGGKSGTTTTTSIAEAEPNDDFASASVVIATPGARVGYISTATDVDHYRTQAVLPGKTISVNLSMPYMKDYNVQVLASDGTPVTTMLVAAGSSELHYVTNSTTTSQTYTLRVYSADGSYSTTGSYTLMVGAMN